GDPTLFADGMSAIARLTNWAPLGLVPFFPEARKLPAEDALGLRELARSSKRNGEALVRIAVPMLPRISNFDDLDPLRIEPGVAVELIEPGNPLPAYAGLVLLPGSNATLGDLRAFRAVGCDIGPIGR